MPMQIPMDMHLFLGDNRESSKFLKRKVPY